MDTLAHYLWAVVLFWWLRKPRHWRAGVVGMLPDLLSFGIFTVGALIAMDGFEPGPPSIDTIPDIVFTLYNITHSLIPITIVAVLLYLFLRDWWWLTWGWYLHIIADVPTHTRAFFPTPIFWPAWSWTFDGFSWGQWWFMLLNYGALAIAFFLLWRRDAVHPWRLKTHHP